MVLLGNGCAGNNEKTILEGVWKSDRKLTIKHLAANNRTTKENIEFLEKNLGKLFISFRGNEIRAFFEDIPESEVEPQTFKVISTNNDFIELEVNRSFMNSERIKFFFYNGCIYLAQKEYKYNEYFCKYKNT